MHTEIETKLKVDSFEKIVPRLTEAGAEFIHEQLHTDSYFDNADRILTNTDCCLRLRRLLVGRSETFFLTYKGAKEKSELKKRQEVEIEVRDGESAEKLLLLLGYNKMLSFEKKRQLWRLDDCEIALDELPLLGCFVEVEGPNSKKIASVQESLKLSGLLHVLESYAALMERKLQELDKKEKEFFLKA